MKSLILLLCLLVIVGISIIIGVRFWFFSAITSLEKCQSVVIARYKLNENPDFIQKYNRGLISKDEFSRIESLVVNEDAKCFESTANKYHIPIDLHQYHNKVVENIPPLPVPLQ